MGNGQDLSDSGQNLSGSGQEEVADCCVCGNEPSGHTQFREFPD